LELPSDIKGRPGVRSHLLAAFAGGATAALLVSAALWQYSRARNYEECMLQEMQGQPAHLYMIANKLCARRFGVKFSIYLATSFTWEPDGEAVRVAVAEPNKDFAITRAFFRFSQKSCAEAKDRDYAEEVAGFSPTGDTFVVRPPDGVKPVCMIGRVTKARFR
jgi:hypothetical protein